MKLLWKRTEEKEIIGAEKILSSEMQFTTKIKKKLDIAPIRPVQLEAIRGLVCG